ncbi:MAG: MFS transporter [Prolixibacteraceae bacterium]|nr:MFS transporter [Prolixibacteraceae bacterium]
MNSNQPYRLWPILVTAMYASFMNPFMLSAINITLPDIQKYFNCSASTLSWISNAFLIANAIVLLPFSKAADMWGRVKIFEYGLFTFTIFTFLAAFSPNITFLIVMRIFQGIGAAFMHVTSLAIVTSVYPPEKRGVALGLNIGAVYAGLSMGPFIGGLLTNIGGWKFVFISVVPLGIFAILLSVFNLRKIHIDKSTGKFDLTGSLIYAVVIFCVVFGGGKILTSKGLLIFIFGIIAGVWFFIYENKQESPIFNIRLFKGSRMFAFSNMAALIHYSATFSIGFMLSLYLQFVKGLSPRDAGLILIAQPIVMAITAPLTGRLSDKIRPGILASSGMFITLAGLLALTFIGSETSMTVIIGILLFIGLGFGLFSSPNTNAIMGSVDKKNYGVATGLTASMRVLGQTFSMMIATIFISLFLGKMQLSQENSDLFLKCMKICFSIFTALCIPGVWFSLQRNK